MVSQAVKFSPRPITDYDSLTINKFNYNTHNQNNMVNNMASQTNTRRARKHGMLIKRTSTDYHFWDNKLGLNSGKKVHFIPSFFQTRGLEIQKCLIQECLSYEDNSVTN